MAQRLDKTVLLPEAHFILEADLDRGRRRKFTHGLRNTSGKVFLNATIAWASSSPYWVLAASRQLLLAGDSTRDYESGGQEFEISSGAHIRYGRARRTWPILCSTMPHAHREPLQYGLCRGAAPISVSYRAPNPGSSSWRTRRNVRSHASEPRFLLPSTGRLQGRSRVSKRGNNIVPAHEIPPQTSHALPRLARLGSRRRAE